MRTAYQADKNTLRLAEAYARLESRQGRSKEALEILRNFDRALPRHPVILDAIERLEKGQTLAPLVDNAVEARAKCSTGLALRAFVRATNSHRSSICCGSRCICRRTTGLRSSALATSTNASSRANARSKSTRACPSSPLKSNAEMQIGVIALETLERKDEAQKHLMALVARDPNDPDALLALANLQRSRKQFAEAAETYTKAIALSEKAGRPTGQPITSVGCRSSVPSAGRRRNGFQARA